MAASGSVLEVEVAAVVVAMEAQTLTDDDCRYWHEIYDLCSHTAVASPHHFRHPTNWNKPLFAYI